MTEPKDPKKEDKAIFLRVMKLLDGLDEPVKRRVIAAAAAMLDLQLAPVPTREAAP